ncbi:aldose 1-epimerase family protein [Pantoea sp. OXWO6B1]|uniref:aldose 1-epimerase family protein n=1 Tax=Pantoea sp. OXWO6B1 TaxID=1835724 RepID=UPI0009EDE263|nr:aldose 1-epimerase family protein [Pantoea sp. OXWO6B1]
MQRTLSPTVFQLHKSFFRTQPLEIVNAAGCSAELFIYESGIEAVRLKNARGYLVVLPYYGQMIWQAMFDGVDLTMQSRFTEPRPASDIVGTYGCFMYHSGLLRNGNPTAEDNHALHGEMPIAPMQRARIETGEDAQGPWLALVSEREYLMGFGDHYLAQPRVVIRPDSATFEVCMAVENLSLNAMDLMYMCHANFAYVEGARIIQPAAFTAADTVIRSSVPAIVKANDAYLARLKQLKQDPASTEVITAELQPDPELVFYIKNLRKAQDGHVHVMLRRPDGDAFTVNYNPDNFPFLTRWILANPMQKVCAFAMPATCGVEGYQAEKRAGHIRSLAGGEKAFFSMTLGYLNAQESQHEEALIRASV